MSGYLDGRPIPPPSRLRFLAFGLAVRYDAIPRNPVRDTVRLQKPPSHAQALTVEQIDAIRTAARSWRRGGGFSGPPPDGQLEQII